MTASLPRLTAVQRRVLEHVATGHVEVATSPPYRTFDRAERDRAHNVSPRTTDRLWDLGLVEYDHGTARTAFYTPLRLTAAGRAALNPQETP